MNDGICKGLCVAVAVAALAGAPTAAAETMTIQAVLEQGGAPVNGIYDLRFRLWDDPTAGTQVGSEVVVEDREVEAGMVVESIDLGAPPSGELRWLEIAVREHDSAGAFTVLGERRALDPTPLANRSARAKAAAQAADALTLEGEPGSTFLEWANLTGVPPDLADGDDDALGGLACAEGQVAKLSGGAWTCADDEGDSFARTWVVGPVGDAAANGAALLGAVAAIPLPTAAHEAQLVKLEPGRYDLGTATLELQPWISLEGSGRGTTVIASAVCISLPVPRRGVVDAHDEVGIRGLTLENTCAQSADYATGFMVHGEGVRMEDVLVRVNCPVRAAYGAECIDEPGLELVDVDVRVLGAEYSTGFVVWEPAVLRRVSAEVQGSTFALAGQLDPSEEMTILDSFFRASGTDAAGIWLDGDARVERSTAIAIATGTNGAGIQVFLDVCASPPCRIELSDVIAQGDRVGLGVTNTTMAVNTTHVVLRGSTVSSAGIGISYTEDAESSSTLEVVDSTIFGAGNSVSVGGYAGPMSVTHSQLAGGPAAIAGTSPELACAGVWDESFAFSTSTCP